MTIAVTCDCGRTLKAPDRLAGKLARCPCGAEVLLKVSTSAAAEGELDVDFGEDSAVPPVALPKRVKQRQREQVFRLEEGEGETDVDESRRRRKVRKKDRQRRDDGDRGPQGRENLLDGLVFSLKFPLRKECLGTVIVLAIGYGTFVNMGTIPPMLVMATFSFRFLVMLGLVTLGAFGYLMYFLMQVLRAASVNEQDLPMASEFDMDQILSDLWCSLGASAISFGPLAIYSSSCISRQAWPNMFVMLALFCAAWAYFPMAMLSVALYHSIMAANPVTVCMAISRVLLEYIVLCVMSGSVLLIVVVASALLPNVFLISGWISWWLLFYCLVSTFYALGNLHYRNREALGWFSELKPKL